MNMDTQQEKNQGSIYIRYKYVTRYKPFYLQTCNKQQYSCGENNSPFAWQFGKIPIQAYRRRERLQIGTYAKYMQG